MFSCWRKDNMCVWQFSFTFFLQMILPKFLVFTNNRQLIILSITKQSPPWSKISKVNKKYTKAIGLGKNHKIVSSWPNPMWRMKCDTWNVTHDMWHMTCDTWHVTGRGRWTFSQNFSSLAFTVFGNEGLLNIFSQRMAEWVS